MLIWEKNKNFWSFSRAELFHLEPESQPYESCHDSLCPWSYISTWNVPEPQTSPGILQFVVQSQPSHHFLHKASSALWSWGFLLDGTSSTVVLSQGQFCPQGGHLAMSGNIFSCDNVRACATGIRWCCCTFYSGQDSPHSKELSSPRCQWCWGWEALL